MSSYVITLLSSGAWKLNVKQIVYVQNEIEHWLLSKQIDRIRGRAMAVEQTEKKNHNKFEVNNGEMVAK